MAHKTRGKNRGKPPRRCNLQYGNPKHADQNFLLINVGTRILPSLWYCEVCMVYVYGGTGIDDKIQKNVNYPYKTPSRVLRELKAV